MRNTQLGLTQFQCFDTDSSWCSLVRRSVATGRCGDKRPKQHTYCSRRKQQKRPTWRRKPKSIFLNLHFSSCSWNENNDGEKKTYKNSSFVAASAVECCGTWPTVWVKFSTPSSPNGWNSFSNPMARCHLIRIIYLWQRLIQCFLIIFSAMSTHARRTHHAKHAWCMKMLVPLEEYHVA